MEQVKNEVKAKLQTLIDGALNDAMASLKLPFGRALHQLVDGMWPAIYKEFEKHFRDVIKKEEQAKKEAEKPAEATEQAVV